MSKSIFPKCLYFLLGTAFCTIYAKGQNTLRLSENPHYVQYLGKPLILITSAEHYGALLNLGFNYITYFDALKKQGMNNTRVFSGSYVERKNDIKWMQYNNTLAPQPNKLIAPWKRSNVTGYINGGNKFNLDQWDNEYFVRLKDLVRQAGSRGIMIELTLFGNQYNDSTYSYSPLYADNNIQGIGKKGEKNFLQFQSLADSALVARQEAMVVKILKEMNPFDNIYYEISNEPYNEVTDSSVVNEWHKHFANIIKKTEENLPKKHLIASNQAIVNNRNVNIANYHYVHISNIPDFDSLLRLNKVISMDETVGPLYDADVNDVRVEAWDFILHGGGAYNNLNWEYTSTKPAGTPGADTIRQYLQYLQQFISTFDYIKMKYSAATLVTPPKKAITRVLTKEGDQYALYIHHSKPNDIVPKNSQFISKYEADTGSFRDKLTLALAPGIYKIRWYNPAKGIWTGMQTILQIKGKNHTFYTPLFTTDIAFSISRK